MMDVDIFAKKYFIPQYDGSTFEINILSDTYNANCGTSYIGQDKINIITDKLKNFEYNKINRLIYKYYDLEYTVEKKTTDDIFKYVISKKYLLQDIHQSKLLVDIYCASRVSNNMFPILNKYHDEICCDVLEYKFNNILLCITKNRIKILFTFNKQNITQLKKDLLIINNLVDL